MPGAPNLVAVNVLEFLGYEVNGVATTFWRLTGKKTNIPCLSKPQASYCLMKWTSKVWYKQNKSERFVAFEIESFHEWKPAPNSTFVVKFW